MTHRLFCRKAVDYGYILLAEYERSDYTPLGQPPYVLAKCETWHAMSHKIPQAEKLLDTTCQYEDFTPPEPELVRRAFLLAHRAHEGQFRKYGDNVPYIHHPAQVVAFTECLHNVTDTMIAAAWLHDVIEDCKQEYVDELRDTFPPEVVKLVEELTNPSKGSSESRKVRKQMDRDHLKTVSPEAKTIKLIDRICNLRDLKEAPADFKELYAKESALLLKALEGTNANLEVTLMEEISKL